MRSTRSAAGSRWKMKRLMSVLAVLLVVAGRPTEGKIYQQCEAVKQLELAKISRSLISNWICLMQSESGMDTKKVTGPKAASSYSYGILQINSAKWCTRGRVGGTCNKRCEDFLNDEIQDDIACAKMIVNSEGFKSWDGWMRKCKDKPLPNIGACRRRRRRTYAEGYFVADPTDPRAIKSSIN